MAAFREDAEAESIKALTERELPNGIDPKAIYPATKELHLASIRVDLEELHNALFQKHLMTYVGDPIKFQYALTVMQEMDPRKRRLFLGEALLPKLIASLEEFIAALLRSGLARYPKALGEMPSVPFDIVDQYGGNVETRDLKRWAIDKKINALISGSPEEWRTRIKAWNRIDLADLGADWGAILEAIQRRHAVIHNGGLVDIEYMERVDKRFLANKHIGGLLICDHAYMGELFNELDLFVQILAIRWAAFMKLDPMSVFPDVVDVVVRLERARRWRAGELLCRAALEAGNIHDIESEDIIRINWWFCRQEIGGEGAALRAEIEAWTPGSELTSPLGKSALLRNENELFALLSPMLKSPQRMATRALIRDMPLLLRAVDEMPELRHLMTSSVPRQGTGKRSSPKRRR